MAPQGLLVSLLHPKTHASLQKAMVLASESCVQWLPEGPSPLHVLFLQLWGVCPHQGEWGALEEARGKAWAPLTELGPPAAGWAELPGWLRAKRGSACLKHQIANRECQHDPPGEVGFEGGLGLQA